MKPTRDERRGTLRRVALVCLAALFALTALAAVPLASWTGGPAAAQERKTLFGVLFGRRKARTKEVKRKAATRRTRKTKRTRKRRAAAKPKATARKAAPRKTARVKKRRNTRTTRRAAAPAPPPKVEKAEDAMVVLVIGDFFAGGLADGLENRLADVAGIRVVDRSNGLSGFVRNDIVDWPTAVAPIVAEVKPDYIVAMAGSNDRQLMRLNGKRVQKRTEEWDAEYVRRISAFGEALRATSVPFTWVGLPPVRFDSMNRDFLVFNALYRKAAGVGRGVKFVDVWDGFSTADGKYTRSGPDVNGQITLLRPKDGINLTRAGRRRLAFYVEQDIRRFLKEGLQTGPAIGFDVEFQQPAQAVYDPARSGTTVVVNLDEPETEGSELLAGEAPTPAGTDGAAVPVSAVTPAITRRQGRVDDYAWPPADALPAPASELAGATPPTPRP